MIVVQTGAGAVTETANVGPKDSVVVFGLGGVGMAALMVRRESSIVYQISC